MQAIKLCNLPQGDFLAFSQDTYDYKNVRLIDLQTKTFESLVRLAQKYRPFQRDIVDVGSYVGNWCINQAKQHTNLTFHMFEIQRMAHYAACGNIALHNVTNVKANLIGLSDQNIMTRLPMIDYTVPGFYQEFSLDNNKSVGDFIFLKSLDHIPLVAIDTLKLAPLVIKIDTNNHLFQIIQGAQKTLMQFEPIILCQFANITTGVQSQLTEWQYTMKVVSDLVSVFIPKWLIQVENLNQILGDSIAYMHISHPNNAPPVFGNISLVT